MKIRRKFVRWKAILICFAVSMIATMAMPPIYIHLRIGKKSRFIPMGAAEKDDAVFERRA